MLGPKHIRDDRPGPGIPTWVALVWVLSLPTTAGASSARNPTSEGPLSLSQALSRVIDQSPSLAAFAWDVQAAEAYRQHVPAMPNPELGANIEDVLGSASYRGGQRAEVTLQLAQSIELGGQAHSRRELAQFTYDRTSQDYHRRRDALLADACQRFFHLLGDQHRLVLAREARTLAEEALAAATRRVQSGAASAMEESRANIHLARSRIAEEHAEHELLSSRQHLAAAWGETEPRFSEVQGDLFERAALPPLADFIDGLARNPVIADLEKQGVLQAAKAAHEEALAVPNLRVNLGARRLQEPAGFAVVAGVGIPLPFFDQNAGEIGAAKAHRAQTEDAQRAARVDIHAEIFAQYQELAHVITELHTLETDVLPQAANMLKVIHEGFKAGRFTQLELIDAQRTLIQVREEHITAAEHYHHYRIQLQTLIGEPPT